VPRPLLAFTLVALVLAATVSPVAAGDGSWTWPVDGTGGGPPTVEREFDPPDTKYGPGNRGIDLATLVGAPVRAVASGVVTFAGRVAGIDVITVDHGTERSTYQPVSASVSVGDRVGRGAVIGKVVLGPFHCSAPCLHLGRIVQPDDGYLDPLDRLGGHSQIRLVDPQGPPPVPPTGPAGARTFQRPVAGPVTSAFGLRTHPTTGKESFHDGVDFGAACGTPVQAAGPGSVVSVGRSPAYGLRVVIRHGAGLVTVYAHLSDASVEVGDRVMTSTVIGKVGSTGLSTGCHLHFGTRRDGQRIDPLSLL
jgi:murein DD-endopeptidase MepM/ murein hydrolase activator NlpD